MSLHRVTLRRGFVVLWIVLLVAAQATRTLPDHHPPPSHHDPQVAVEPASTSLRGGRGPEHCALSIGIFLGGALGFWVNPFLGTQAMRLGLMASVLHCA